MLVRYPLAAVLAAGALSGCGNDEPDAAPFAGIENATSAPSDTASPAVTVNPDDKTRRNWIIVSLSKDEKSVTLRWDHRTCGKGPQLDTAELDDEVEILTSDYVDGNDCAAQPKAKWEKIDVPLDKPLGDRRLAGCNKNAALDCTKDWTKN